MLNFEFPTTPILVINSKISEYYQSQKSLLEQQPINKLIDKYDNHPKIILIANRVAMRGVSFVSSNYSRHVTHQLTNVKSSLTNLLQNARICGVYSKPNQPLKLSFCECKNKTKSKLEKKMIAYKQCIDIFSS